MRILLVFLFGALLVAGCSQDKDPVPVAQQSSGDPAGDLSSQSKPSNASRETSQAAYSPVINPAEFTTDITNEYLSLPLGKRMVYSSLTEDGPERIDILIPGWTRNIEGVETLVFWDRVYLDGQLIEDTRDYLAQHKGTGDVWYFGEHVDNYEDGVLKDHEGAWLTGVDGAEPGIWALANPRAGDAFRNEYYRGFAEDMTEIIATNQTVTTPLGTYTNCVKTLDWSPLFEATANNYFCKEVGGTALEVELAGPGSPTEQRIELIELNVTGASDMPTVPRAYADEGVVGPTPGAGSN